MARGDGASAPSVAERTARHALWLALARASFGAPAVAAPATALRLLGPRRGRQPGPARFFAGFFGVRELVLAGFLVAARRDPQRLRSAVAFGALADMGDSVLLLREILSRKQVEPQAALLLSTGLLGSAASIALWRELGGAPPP